MRHPSPDPFLSFDFDGHDGRRQHVIFTRPVEVVVAHSAGDVRPALGAVRRAVDAGLYAAGYVGYEAAPAFDPALVAHPPSEAPVLWFGIFRGPSKTRDGRGSGEFRLTNWEPSVSRAVYDEKIGIVRAAIEQGDTYQVNYSIRMRARSGGDDFALYRRLRESQGARYGAYLDTGRFRILSASPELFFHVRGSRITTRPMKGTIRRGRATEEDERRRAWLASSEKNRAENVMIVDLLRNDLSRIAKIGSVRVPELFCVESYPKVFQMTSTVAAELRPGVTLEDMFGALFPCGSVTGAPKVSTMRIIREVEDTPRQVYCGAIGMVSPRGEAVFNVAIRTILLDSLKGVAEYGVGGGVTWDSNAEDEYEEVLAKAAILPGAEKGEH